MKTFKLLFAAIIFVGFANAVSAQTQDNADVTASAEVWVPISINLFDNNNIDFGIVFSQDGQTPALDPDDGNATDAGNLGSSTSLGIFEITGEPGKAIKFQLDDNISLDNNDGNTLTFTPDVRFNNTSNAGGVELDANGNDIHSGGTSYLILGGSIDDLDSSTPSGTYEGTLNVQVDYTGI